MKTNGKLNKSITEYILDSYDEAMGGSFNGRTMEECFNICKVNTEQLYKDGITFYDIFFCVTFGVEMGYPVDLGSLALLTLEPSNEEEMEVFGRKFREGLKRKYEQCKNDVLD